MSMELITNHPLFGIVLSILAYTLAQSLYRRWLWIHPLFICSGSIIVFLVAMQIPYEAYESGAKYISVLLGPATVALGVPLYQHRALIRKHLRIILPAIIVGSLAGLISVIVLVGLLSGSREILLALLPKSVTSPIAIEIGRRLGAIPELSAVFAVLTGLLGSMFGATLLRSLGIKSDLAIGIAIGTASHGIGTAKIIRESAVLGSLSSFAMALAGILVSLLFIPLYYLF